MRESPRAQHRRKSSDKRQDNKRVWVIKLAELPEENELVIAIIKKIMPYGAICELIEYNNKEAFLHISEVASRWIKNIHEFISEGQRIVAKVHHIDKEKNQIDISIKRVSDEEKRRKLEQVNFKNRAKKLIEVAFQGTKTKKTNAEELLKKMEEEYGDAYSCLKEIAEKGEEVLDKFDLPKSLKAKLVDIVQKNIKKQIIEVTTTIKYSCFGGNGINLVKEGLLNAIKNKQCKVHYIGAPRYKITVTADDYKIAQKEMTDIIKKIENYAKKNPCVLEIERGNE